MRNRLWYALMLLALLAALGQQVQAGQPTKATLPEDLAELMPASTLVYVELKHRPVIEELRTLFKGSAFKDYAAFRNEVVQKMGTRGPEYFGSDGSSFLAALLAPELLDELHRFRGHAIAVTEFPKNKGKGKRPEEPRFIWIMDGGDSNIPNLIVREVLILAPSFRTVTKVNGVRLYQEKRIFYEDQVKEGPERKKEESKKDDKDKPHGGKEKPQARKEPTPRFGGPVIALLPKVAIIGSDVDLVRDVVLRMQGKKDDPSLAGTPEFKKQADLRKKPGLFAYYDLAKLVGPKGHLRDREPEGIDSIFGVDQVFVDALTLFNPEALKSGTAHLGVEKGTLELQLRIEVDTDKGGPSTGLFFSRSVNPEAFYFAPADSFFVLSLPVTGDAGRWERLLKQLDKQAPTQGFLKQFTGDNVRNFEKAMKFNLGKDLVNRLAGITVAFPPDTFRGNAMPLLILEGKDEAGAKLLENFVPRLLKVLNQKEEVVTRRQGNFVILGANDKAVSAALEAGKERQGFGAQRVVAGVLAKAKGAKTLGIWSLQGILAAQLADDVAAVEQHFKKKEKKPNPNREGSVPSNRKEMEQYTDWLKKSRDRLDKITTKLPGGEVSVQTDASGFTFRVRQTGLTGAAAPLTDYLLEREIRRVRPEYRYETREKKED